MRDPVSRPPKKVHATWGPTVLPPRPPYSRIVNDIAQGNAKNARRTTYNVAVRGGDIKIEIEIGMGDFCMQDCRNNNGNRVRRKSQSESTDSRAGRSKKGDGVNIYYILKAVE